MKDSKNIPSFGEFNENLNISDVSDRNLISEIKKHKDKLLIELEKTLKGGIIPQSFFNLSELIDRL